MDSFLTAVNDDLGVTESGRPGAAGEAVFNEEDGDWVATDTMAGRRDGVAITRSMRADNRASLWKNGISRILNF
jgi:hypothetical protein